MQKLGMKPVPNISRVTIKKSKNVSLSATLPVSVCAVCRDHSLACCFASFVPVRGWSTLEASESCVMCRSSS